MYLIDYLVPPCLSQYPAIDDAAGSDVEEEEQAEGPLKPMVAEQRLSNLIQSLMMVASLALMHVIQLIPTAVIWCVLTLHCFFVTGLQPLKCQEQLYF